MKSGDPPRPEALGSLRSHTGPSSGTRTDLQTVIIEPTRRRVRIPDLWRTSAVVRVIAERDFKAKYKQSILGPLWLVLQPLALLAAFSVVFSRVADVSTAGASYATFALVGLTAWTYLQVTLLTGANSLIVNATLIRRVACPRIVFPTACLIAGLPVLGVTLLMMFLTAAIVGDAISIRVVLLPIVVAWLLVFAWGLVAVLAAVGARFRDIVNLLPVAMQAGLFVTPIAFPVDAAGGFVSTLLKLNPLTGILETWRWTVIPAASLDIGAAVIAAVWTVLVAIIGWRVFTRIEVEMADFV